MAENKNILIIKHGALGDVVRTAYFAKPLRNQNLSSILNIRLYWLTAPQSLPLLRFNPYIDVVTTRIEDLVDIEFDEVYSLDDETEVLNQLTHLNVRKVVGARFNSINNKIYCDQSAYWFDMGLLSRHGKNRADELKRLNNRSHSSIFKELFNVDRADFNFYNSDIINADAIAIMQKMSGGKVMIGLNAFAGKRWPAKALPSAEFSKLVQALSRLIVNGQSVHLFLLGSGSDLHKNQKYIMSEVAPSNVTALDTDANVLELAATVRSLELLITADSLCLHLAVSQQVPTVAFFAPTSAAEIEDLPHLRKLKSLSEDYCNYRPDAENESITCERILAEVEKLFESVSYA
jgi:heptosyltransferase-2